MRNNTQPQRQGQREVAEYIRERAQREVSDILRAIEGKSVTQRSAKHTA